MYPIDPKIAESKGIRKYGFHGLSYSFIIRAVAEYLKKVSPPVHPTARTKQQRGDEEICRKKRCSLKYEDAEE